MGTSVTLSSGDFWDATAIAILADVILVGLLAWRIRRSSFRTLGRPLAIASGVLWAAYGCLLVWVFWDFYYQYFFPEWLRWSMPLVAPLYSAVALGLWWLGLRVPGSPAVTFCLFGGLWGLAEHLPTIYAWGILEKVPALRGVDSTPVVVFAFFEYVIYWGVVLALAARLGRLSHHREGQLGRQRQHRPA